MGLSYLRDSLFPVILTCPNKSGEVMLWLPKVKDLAGLKKQDFFATMLSLWNIPPPPNFFYQLHPFDIMESPQDQAIIRPGSSRKLEISQMTPLMRCHFYLLFAQQFIYLFLCYLFLNIGFLHFLIYVIFIFVAFTQLCDFGQKSGNTNLINISAKMDYEIKL